MEQNNHTHNTRTEKKNEKVKENEVNAHDYHINDGYVLNRGRKMRDETESQKRMCQGKWLLLICEMEWG